MVVHKLTETENELFAFFHESSFVDIVHVVLDGAEQVYHRTGTVAIVPGHSKPASLRRMAVAGEWKLS